jgi:SH3-like domain-containing protein
MVNRTHFEWPSLEWSRITLALWLLALSAAPISALAQTAGPASGLPVPRYVSLKVDKVNVRKGPSREHEVNWVFTRAGLPVEITAEFENWRRIRDAEGSEGWVFHSLLSGRRTALISPWSKSQTFALHERPDLAAPVSAQLQPGVLGTVRGCNGRWCRIFGDGFDGFIEQERLWGVYPNEPVQ